MIQLRNVIEKPITGGLDGSLIATFDALLNQCLFECERALIKLDPSCFQTGAEFQKEFTEIKIQIDTINQIKFLLKKGQTNATTNNE